MLKANTADKQFLEAYEICKLQAAADGAFSEPLMQHWFKAAWDLCAGMIGHVYPPQQITERVTILSSGSFRLSHQPTSDVRLYAGATLVAVLPPSLQMSDRWLCRPSLCCYCDLLAQYDIGEETCEISPRFLQAVARLFAYMVENRGDVELDREVLAKCGALAWLGPDLTYVA